MNSNNELTSDGSSLSGESDRVQEYAFLIGTTLSCTALAICADLINLQVSSEYFTFGKGLPFDHLTRRVAWLAVRASYWVGAILGVVFLAVNSFGAMPPLPIGRLWRLVLSLLIMSLILSVLAGLVFVFNTERFVARDLIYLRQPRRFAFVWGFNNGGYLSALLALIGGPIWILRNRRRLATARKQAQGTTI